MFKKINYKIKPFENKIFFFSKISIQLCYIKIKFHWLTTYLFVIHNNLILHRFNLICSFNFST